MSLWSNTDANTSAPKFAPAGGLGVAQNGDALFGNTTISQFVTGAALGVFGVDAAEQVNAPKGGHAGWVLRKVGSGGRAGRVQVETLVAMGSMSSDAEDVVYPDTVITITTQPVNTSNVAGGNAAFTVVATSNPPVALGYQWFDANTDTQLSGETSSTLALTNIATQNIYYVVVSADGAANVQSSTVTLSITP